MAEIILKSVDIRDQSEITNYVTAMVLDCSYGFEGIKLIKSVSELERYYYGLKSRSGLNELINAGSNLLIKRLERKGTTRSTLRLLDHPDLKYVHPKNFDIIDDLTPYNRVVDVDPYNKILKEKGLADSIQYDRTHTYNYVIDFNDSDMLEGDFIAIPKYTNSVLDNSILFYFTDFEPTDGTSVSFPDDFTPPVTLDSIGVDTIAINAQRTELKDSRAKIIFDWYLGNLYSDDRYFHVNGSGDNNVIQSLCELDEVNNKVTLVFKKPVSNIKYNKSVGEKKFSVTSNEHLDYELLADATLNNSIVSFESLLLGKSEFKLKFSYVGDYEFFLDITYRESLESFNVSLDRDALDFSGESLFIEDVLSKNYDLLRCHVNIGTRIESTDIDHFSEEDASKLEGTYYVSKGIVGDASPVYDEDLNYNRYPFYDSIDELAESDVPINLFLFDEFSELRYQMYAEENLINNSGTIGLVTIPDEFIYVEDKPSYLESYLLPRKRRSHILYVLGESLIKSEFVYNTFYYALIGVRNKFTTFIKDNKFISELDEDDKKILDTYKVNYIENHNEEYYINFIHNHPEFLEPSYLFVANYIHRDIERYLKSNLGKYSNKLYMELSTKLSSLETYSNLVTKLELNKFNINNNEVSVNLDLELSGLSKRILQMQIQINK